MHIDIRTTEGVPYLSDHNIKRMGCVILRSPTNDQRVTGQGVTFGSGRIKIDRPKVALAKPKVIL